MLTPQELEQQRQNEANISKLKLELAGIDTVDANGIQKGTPDDLKAQGASKLPFIIYTLGNQVKTIIQPSLNNLIKQYIEKYNTQGVCLNPQELNELRRQRDLIVNQLNNIGIKIDRLGKTITGISNFLNILITLITTTDLLSIATKLALKIPPANTIPVPASITTLLDDAQTLIRKATFNQLGDSKLSKYKSLLGSSALILSIISSYILNAIESLKIIDSVLKECDPNNTLLPINPQINDIANAQFQASITENEITYNGFIIEIETIPFTPTVNRRRALGKNQSGIVLIQTELSFTTNDQILINELKLIIDRDNLKAY